MRIVICAALFAFSQALIGVEPLISFENEHSRKLLSVKGFWMGFNRGFYKSSTEVPEQCINTESLVAYQEAKDILNQEEDVQGDIFTVIADYSKVINNLSTACNLRQPYRDIQHFCDDEHGYYRSQTEYWGEDGELNLCTL